MTTLSAQLARCINEGMETVTSDDVTDCGRIALDADHKANGKQSGIGSFFRTMAAQGVIVSTGQAVKSKAPKRKGGMIQVWKVTAAGRDWATARKRRRLVLKH
jgi:hypothetical protein